MAFVEFHDVRKVYKMGEVEVAAVDGMMGGMDSCTSGTILLDGRKISSYSDKELVQYRRHDIGFVFQFYNLVQNLTALENVELAAQICTDPLPADEALRLVGLEHRMDNFPAQLSGGEQQRVAIARALAKNPKLLLCDEPTGALDYRTGKAVLRLLQEASTVHGATVVLITHNTAFTAIADRVIHIKEGKAESVEVNDHPVSALELEW